MARKLYYGCYGDDVKELQRNLNDLGFNCGAVDGSFGTMTYNAVIRFQTSCGIIVDGIVGNQTRTAIAGKLKAKKAVVVQGTKIKTSGGAISKEIGRWNGHKFIVSPTQIYSFTGLTIKGSSELLNKDDSEQGYVSWKGANPTEVTLTVHLNAYVGCDVRAEANSFITDSYSGKRDYFYVGSSKLVPELLMLVDAQVKEVQIAADGKTWVAADITLTMKSCKSYDNAESTSSASSGGGGYSGYSGYTGGYKVSTQATTPTTTITKTGKKLTTSTAVTLLKKYAQQQAAMKAATLSATKKVVTTQRVAGAGGGKVVAMTR